MGAHDGHRGRMRERILSEGMDNMQCHEVLEYILYHFVPRRDTNELAHKLIDTFGSFSDVLNADADHLAAVSGMTENAAIFLSSLPDIFRKYAVDTGRQRKSFNGKGSIRDFMRKELYGCPVEQVYIAAVDPQDQLIRFEKLASGNGDSVDVSLKKIVAFAMRTNASSIVIAHNHPSGKLAPSQCDYELTKEILYLLGGIGVRLHDHYIFNNDSCYSFNDSGVLKIMAKEREAMLKEGLNYYG